MRVGVVLGGGGLTGGAFHNGVLAAWADAGWDARDAAVWLGTSAGSITATALAAGMPPLDMLRRWTKEPLSPQGQAVLNRVDRDAATAAAAPTARALRPASPKLLGAMARRPSRLHPGRLVAAALPAGRESTAGIAHGMGQMCAGSWPSERLRIAAVRLDDGATVLFGAPGAPTAPVGQAVAASCAIPGYFAPVEIDGRRYVDGGTVSACNAAEVLHEQLDAVIISAPMAIHASARPALDAPWRRLLRRQVDREAAHLRAAGAAVFLFAPDAAVAGVMGPNPMAPGRERAVAAAAYRMAAARIAEHAGMAAVLARR